jgi:2-keto-3-deoxy-6-phosphogluconate aldolase
VTPSESVWETLKRNRLIALLAPQSAADCVHTYEALDPLGIVIEVALRTEAAFDGITAIRDRYPDYRILAGTVITREQAARAIDVGVAGVVSPDYFPQVVEACIARDVMCVPGGLADVGKQLAQKAELYNCSLEELREQRPYQWVYKLFPSMAGGSAVLDLVPSWRAVYKDLTIVYSGGLGLESIPEVVRRDPTGILCGSALTRSVDDPVALVAEAQRWLARIHAR